MSKVVTYKKLKNETEAVMSYSDVLNIIEENLGSDIVVALLDYCEDDIVTPKDKMITYIEDGVFMEQVRESGVVNKIVESLLVDLEDQGYLKKSKNIKNFIPDEEALFEHIDMRLSPGMINYFEK